MTTKINGTNTAASPAITGADTDTGLSFGTDTVNINTGGVTRATVDSNGRLGIGITSPISTLHLHEAGASGSPIIQFSNGDTGTASSDGFVVGVADNESPFIYNRENTDLRIATNNTERMRITSGGSLLIGRTTSSSFGNLLQTKSITVETDGDTTGMHFNRTDSNAAWIAMRFYAQGNLSGYIQVNTSSVIYSTSSDYRLKENVVSISDGITRLKQLKPYRFNFKNNPSVTVDGFYAHETSEVVPESVVGEKDAVDAEGNIDAQGIDQAKLVPLLTAALQEAITKIETLETKVAALEGA